ncbi:unnamed protein product [Caenorhabditis bovis]|uniref:UPAR/Ly6 domain-containing protein n=1 Tax=Caenorhabditis bovis TaxID=2654633 RepID=A0A8S1EBU4_9PELO|nr:unnamed protein product [Caenorhabditis bovis]
MFHEFSQTCTGDICVISRYSIGSSHEIMQTCVSGVEKIDEGCLLDYEDQIICYCQSDLCNVRDMYMNQKIVQMPSVECKLALFQTIGSKIGNNCVLIRKTNLYMDLDTGKMNAYPPHEEVGTTDSQTNAPIIFKQFYTPSYQNIAESFFANACYNVTLSESTHYHIHCKCNTLFMAFTGVMLKAFL